MAASSRGQPTMEAAPRHEERPCAQVLSVPLLTPAKTLRGAHSAASGLYGAGFSGRTSQANAHSCRYDASPHSAVFTSERLLLTSVRSVEDFDEKPGTRVHSFAAEGRGKPA